MEKDLTVGNPHQVLVQFSLPLFGSILFQQLYNIADSLVAGKWIGESALAAVGNGYEVTLIYLAFAFGCNVGCSVVMAQMFGAKRHAELRTAVSTAFLATGALCAALMLLGFTLIPTLLRAIHTPKELMADTVLYLNIYTGGLLFLFFYNIATGIFSALGDSRTPFWFLAVSSTANIFIDIWFVRSFHMGVAGVAWATFLCQGISCTASVGLLLKRVSRLSGGRPRLQFSLPIFRQIAAIAIPSTVQQSFVSVGNIFLQSLINGFGTSVIAGYAAAIKVNNFVVTCLTTMGTAVSNFAAQNLGAKKIARVRQGARAGFRMAAAFGVVFTALCILLRRQLVGIFMDDASSRALQEGVKLLVIITPFYCVVACKLVADGVLRGAGAMRYFLITTFSDLILRVALSFILAPQLGPVGIWISWPIGWGISTAIAVIFYLRGVWQRHGDAAPREPHHS